MDRAIVFCADVETLGEFELYVVPSDGSTGAVRLSDDSRAGSVESFAISSDSDAFGFPRIQAANDVIELWSVPLDGSACAGPAERSARREGRRAQRLSSQPGRYASRLPPRCCRRSLLRVERADLRRYTRPPHRFRDGLRRRWFPDQARTRPRVVYRADPIVANRQELFSVPIDGSASAVRLNGPLAAAADVQNDYVVGTDARVSIARMSSSTNRPSCSRARGRIRARGAARRQPPAERRRALRARLPDEARVVFRANPASPRVELFSVLPTARKSASRSARAPPAAAMLPGTSRSAPTDRASCTAATPSPTAACPGTSSSIGAIAGGPEVKLNAALVAGELVHPDFEISARRIDGGVPAGAPTSVSLFARAIDASAPPIVLDGSGALVASSKLTIGSDGERVLLRRAGTAQRAARRQRRARGVQRGVPHRLAVGPDASFTAYRMASDPDFPSVVALFSRATDGSSAADVLSPPFLAIDTVAGGVAWLPMEGEPCTWLRWTRRDVRDLHAPVLPGARSCA
jgi:hypothetical protein